MRFSFIEARKKPIVSKQIKILIGSILAVELIIWMLNISITTQIDNFEQIIEANSLREEKLDDTLKTLYKRERLIRREAKQVSLMREKNRELSNYINQKLKRLWQSQRKLQQQNSYKR